MRSSRCWSYPRASPVPSYRPYSLARELIEAGVAFETVGSALTGEPARDLDVVLDTDPANIVRLRFLLEEIGAGSWSNNLDRVVAEMTGVVTIHTTHGPLDIHPRRTT